MALAIRAGSPVRRARMREMASPASTAPIPAAASNSANCDGGRCSTWRAYSDSTTRNEADVNVTAALTATTRRTARQRATSPIPSASSRRQPGCSAGGAGRTASGATTAAPIR